MSALAAALAQVLPPPPPPVFASAELDHTHASVIRRFKSVRGDTQVRVQWRVYLEHGEVAGPMWVALSHRDA
jgi:hypothetical protein